MQFKTDHLVFDVDTPVDELVLDATLQQNLEPGESLAFSLPESWSVDAPCAWVTKHLQTQDPSAPNYAAIEADGSAFSLKLEPLPRKDHTQRVVATLEQGTLTAGDPVRVVIRHIRSTWRVDHGRFRFWVNDHEQAETVTLETLPQPHDKLRVIVPSSAKPGEAFTARVISLDPHWNLSSSTITGSLAIESGGTLSDEVSFTGFKTLQVSLAEEGVYRLTFGGAVSNPIVISATWQGPLWGDLHAHDKTHNCGFGELAMEYGRDASGLDFICLTPAGITTEAHWKAHQQRIQPFDRPGVFTALLGYEHQKMWPSQPGRTSGSHHNIIYRDPHDAPFAYEEPDLRAVLAAETAMAIPHHTGINWGPNKGFRPEYNDYIPLMEVYSIHGQGEYYNPDHVLSYEYNRVRHGMTWASSMDEPLWARNAWAAGCRYGVIASSDDHAGAPGKPINGLAAVWSAENDHSPIWQALKARHCYGTTGERIIMEFNVNGQPMGSQVHAMPGDRLEISLRVHGTASLAFVELMKYDYATGLWDRVHYAEMKPQSGLGKLDLTLERDYMARFELPYTGSTIYYARTAQRSQTFRSPAFAWSSPIWVDSANGC